MSSQARLNIDNRTLVKREALTIDDATLAQYAAAAQVKGQVLGLQEIATLPTTGTADGGNTGDGTVTDVAQSATGAPAKVGTYTVECIVAAANSGTFKIVDPDGVTIGEVTIPAGAGNDVTFTGGGITLKITDGTTDFVVGDKFTIAVTASGKYLPVVAGATDGSLKPVAILAEDADATAGDLTNKNVYIKGEFFENRLTFTGSLDADSVITVNGVSKTIREWFTESDIYIHATIDIEHYENT